MSDFSYSATCRRHGQTFAPDDGGCPGCELEKEALDEYMADMRSRNETRLEKSDPEVAVSLIMAVYDAYWDSMDHRDKLMPARLGEAVRKILDNYGMDTELDDMSHLKIGNAWDLV